MSNENDNCNKKIHEGPVKEDILETGLQSWKVNCPDCCAILRIVIDSNGVPRVFFVEHLT